MSLVMAAVYDRFMRRVEKRSFGPWREELLAGLRGRVLEVGAGTGVNLPYYPEAVTRLVLAEPDAQMRRRLQDRIALSVGAGGGKRSVEVTRAGLERLSEADGSLDAVVCTLVLCSVPDPMAALTEVYRVLRPGGQLVFLEHVAAEHDPQTLALQRLVEPLWRHVAEGCRLTRSTRQTIAAAGFEVAGDVREQARGAWPIVGTTVRGLAQKPLA